MHEAPQPVTLRLSLHGEPLFELSENVELAPNESKMVYFMPPKLSTQYECRLKVEGLKGIQLSNATTLQVEDYDNSLKVYIQTDKGIYKPGDVVQFRVVVLDEHLKPFKSVEPIKVEILVGK